MTACGLSRLASCHIRVERSGGRGKNVQPREILHADKELLRIEEQFLRLQQRPLRIAPEQVVARCGIARERGDGLVHIVVQAQRGILRQVVEQRGGVFEEQRQVILDARRRIAFADVLVDVRPGWIALEALAEALAKARLPVIVEREFACRQQADFRHRIQRALGVHIEGGDGLDLVVEQVDAVRQHAAHRKQVDDAAAHAVFAGRQHLLHMAVSGKRHLLAQLVQVEPFAALEEEGICGQIFDRRQRIQRGGHRHHQHVAGPAAHMMQRRQPFGDQVLVRRKVVVGQRLPVRQQMHAQAGVEERNLLDQPLRFLRVRGDHDHRRVFCGVLRQCQRVGRTLQAGIAGTGMF